MTDIDPVNMITRALLQASDLGPQAAAVWNPGQPNLTEEAVPYARIKRAVLAAQGGGSLTNQPTSRAQMQGMIQSWLEGFIPKDSLSYRWGEQWPFKGIDLTTPNDETFTTFYLSGSDVFLLGSKASSSGSSPLYAMTKSVYLALYLNVLVYMGQGDWEAALRYLRQEAL